MHKRWHFIAASLSSGDIWRQRHPKMHSFCLRRSSFNFFICLNPVLIQIYWDNRSAHCWIIVRCQPISILDSTSRSQISLTFGILGRIQEGIFQWYCLIARNRGRSRRRITHREWAICQIGIPSNAKPMTGDYYRISIWSHRSCNFVSEGDSPMPSQVRLLLYFVQIDMNTVLRGRCATSAQFINHIVLTFRAGMEIICNKNRANHKLDQQYSSPCFTPACEGDKRIEEKMWLAINWQRN